MRIIVVGAGLAGLTCAKVSLKRDAEIVVFEASDGIGGRIRTDEKDGFLLDRGFRGYFTAYPVARRHLDHGTLNLEAFDPGTIVRRGREENVLSGAPYPLSSQPPCIYGRQPENGTSRPGLVLAGEYTEDSSINGSMLSGEETAEEVMRA
jgi:uncharacterized protein with NAD-binding domain and iron-sulfur cluster